MKTAFFACLALCVALPAPVHAQTKAFAGGAQHTADYPVAAQRLSSTHWSTQIDLVSNGSSAHYGQPLVTASNTVLVPVRVSSTSFKISAFDGSTGRLKYTLTNDFIPASVGSWVSPYQPVLASPGGTLTLCYPGPGGTVYYVANPDSDTPSAPIQICFYTNLSGFASNAAAYKSAIYLDTPLTADTNGNLFFGFRTSGTAPAPISSTSSGFARIDSSGNGAWVLTKIAAGDSTALYDSHNSAPALSGDGSTVYVAASRSSGSGSGYLLGLNTTNLSTKYRAYLMDPRNTNNGATLYDDSTASPMVGPDGDVYMGVLANPGNGSRGFLLHFSADLQTRKPPGGFGWDDTAAIVPTNMLPGYSGSSPYLIFSKYNNYAGGDANGINKIALLDPGATQLDPHSSATGLVEMRELLTVIGPTADSEFLGATYPHAVREWCVNTCAVNPATHSIIAPSEDGQVYRWDLAANSLAEVYTLGSGIGEPYVPSSIGPDGTVYSINGAKLFALGSLSNVDIAVYSSTPDLRTAVVGQSVSFTAVVTNLNGSGPVPTGSVTFFDKYYLYLTAHTNTLGTVTLSNGVASISTAALTADNTSTNNGNHFITASYSGDTNFPAGSATMVQKIHAYATVTTLTPSTASNAVIFTAKVSGVGGGAPVPTGFIAFSDGLNFLAQLPLGTNGSVAYVTTNLSAAPHAITAAYTSDTLFAASTGTVIASPIRITGATFGTNGLFQLSFTNSIGASFTALGSPDLTVPLSNWSILGPVTEVAPGVFQFQDLQSSSNLWQFYRVRSP